MNTRQDKVSNHPVDIESIYNDFIESKNEENRVDRYEGNEHWYHASAIGLCSRRLYYESIEKVKPTNKPNMNSMRIMRLGTVVHEDIQKSLSIYTNIYNNIYTNKKKKLITEKKKNNIKFHIENEITLPTLNVRGFYDLVAEVQANGIFLYDIKTVGSYPWKLKFGKQKELEPSNNHFLQVATYGLGIREEFGQLDGMYILYYNKDTSALKQVEVPQIYLSMAESYWININKEHQQGVPQFSLGTSPYKAWVCDYCQFKDHCGSPFGKQGRK